MADLAVAELERAHERIVGRFTRSEPRARVREYVPGLVAGLERKNGWTLAERAGEAGPDGMQRLLRRADWDIDGVRDDVRDCVVGYLGRLEGVLIADETGSLQKGILWVMLVHLDTDLGGDTDDACALALLLGQPTAELAGVTTVADRGGRRAGYARHCLDLAGRDGIPVAAGAGLSMTTLQSADPVTGDVICTVAGSNARRVPLPRDSRVIVIRVLMMARLRKGSSTPTPWPRCRRPPAGSARFRTAASNTASASLAVGRPSWAPPCERPASRQGDRARHDRCDPSLCRFRGPSFEGTVSASLIRQQRRQRDEVPVDD